MPLSNNNNNHIPKYYYIKFNIFINNNIMNKDFNNNILLVLKFEYIII